MTLLFTEHDMNIVFGIADRVSVLHHGEIIASGTPDDVRANTAVQEVYLGRPAH
ncbi:Choline transport ATP-binding protein OpuBA [compost metagenome]